MAEPLHVYMFSWTKPWRERSEQIHEYSYMHYVQFEMSHYFAFVIIHFAPTGFDISW
jgi:hypothetical protein